jgi:hypothetical protein
LGTGSSEVTHYGGADAGVTTSAIPPAVAGTTEVVPGKPGSPLISQVIDPPGTTW